MVNKAQAFDELVKQALNLTPIEKVRLMERLAVTLETDLTEREKKSHKSLYGLWADLHVDISEDDIDEIRREMWSNFPREDI
jgi:hypothetical protein